MFIRFITSPLAAALFSALLLWLSFFPANWGWLGWVALVPFLHLLVRPEPRRVLLSGWLGGLAFAVAALQWVRLASAPMYVTWIALALYVALAFFLFTWLCRRLVLRAGWPLIVAAPVSWTAFEYLRAHFDIGFSWYYLGHTQHDYLPLIQFADLVGAYGVSFLVVMGNVVCFHFYRRWRNNDARAARQATAAALATTCVLLAVLGYGFWRLSQNDFETGPRLALLQSNLPQDLRNDPNQKESARDHCVKLANRAAETKPDLIVWPETSYPSFWMRFSPHTDLSRLPEQEQTKWREEDQMTQKIAGEIAQLWRTSSLIGINAYILEPDGERDYNSAVLIAPDGVEQGRYDKVFCIPFGEYLPFVDIIPQMKYLSPYGNADYSIDNGRKYTVFSTPGVANGRFAVLICYEDTVPHCPRRFFSADGQSDPNFFVNISNDGWFKGSEEHEQHLVSARFRAVECRRAVARAVNMGVSAVIDGNGRIVAMPGETLYASKNRPAIVVAEIPIDRRQSFYVRFGDVLPLTCLVLCGVGLVWSFRKHRQEKPDAK